MAEKTGIEKYNLAIIGAGPAGMAAAIRAADAKLNFVLLSRDAEGDFPDFVNHIPELEKYGFHSINYSRGYELVTKFSHYAKEGKINAKRSEGVLLVAKKSGWFEVKTNKSQYEAKTVLVATGRRVKTIVAKNMEKFRGRGVSNCVFCDGAKFRGKDVAVVGGGKAGIMAALFMLKLAKKVYVIEKGAGLSAENLEEQAETLRKSEKAEILNNAQISELLGEENLSGIKITRLGDVEEIPCEAVFIETTRIPNSEIAMHLVKTDSLGQIAIDKHNATACDGMFAAGDVTNFPDKWLAAAADQGLRAMDGIMAYLKKRNNFIPRL